MNRFAILAALLCAASTQALAQDRAAPDRYVLVRCGRLLAVPGNPPQTNATLVVKNGKVDRVSAGLTGPSLPAGTAVEEVDLRDSFVLPGLIDCHVHISSETTPDRILRAVTESEADFTINAVVYARRTLDAGFTTVRDCGSTNDAVLALRDGINEGKVAGPRIIASGKGISVTGGHGDPTNPFQPSVVGEPGIDRGVADGPAACAQAVRHQIKLGADVIKLTATGGVLSVSTAGLRQHFTDQELASIVQTAKMMGRKVCAHAHGTDGINAALKAGVDSIEHGTYLDDESISLFKQSGAYLVPTLLAGATVAKNATEPGYYPLMVVAKALEVGPKMLAAFRKAHEGGVKIAFGTDSGVSPHGQNAQEFALMVEGGMTPAQAIRAATIAAADLLGLSSEVGTLEPGKSADLIAVRGDPLTDVRELERVTFVMRAGMVYKHVKPSP
jgi:imidazolonepropionase-like amidohydrolase